MPILGGKILKLACRATLSQTTDCVAQVTGICQNWNLSEFIFTQNWNLSELEFVRIGICQNCDPVKREPHLPVHSRFLTLTVDTGGVAADIK